MFLPFRLSQEAMKLEDEIKEHETKKAELTEITKNIKKEVDELVQHLEYAETHPSPKRAKKSLRRL
jgi:HPt (histidine-containing phosphotransfer) domain-containing protein